MKILAAFSIIVNFALIYFFVFKGETYTTSDDRVGIEMSKDRADFVMDEMRSFLESVQQINSGILNKDAKSVIAGGAKSGGSVIEHAPEGMLRTFPVGFKKLGFSAHDLFDQIKKMQKKTLTHIRLKFNWISF